MDVQYPFNYQFPIEFYDSDSFLIYLQTENDSRMTTFKYWLMPGVTSCIITFTTRSARSIPGALGPIFTYSNAQTPNQSIALTIFFN